MITSLAFPTKILTGPGALGALPDQLQALRLQRPLVVTDAGLVKTAAFQLLLETLSIPPAQHMVAPNPTAEDVAECARAFQACACDGVIGFGGGSALDVAKIVRVAVQPGPKPWAEVTWQDDLRELVPFIAIPTTAGTGSEVGRSSVIIFDQAKHVIFHPALLAAVVILDPRLTMDLPPKLTAATGLDALTHCIEAATSTAYHPLCEAIALEGARLALQNLPGAVAHGSDLAGREQMQMAALMGGIAFQKDLGAVHSLSHPLSAHFGVHHGLANALCLLPVLRWNARARPGVYRRLAVATETGSTDADFIAAIERLLEQVGIGGGLSGQGVPDGALTMLAEAAFADGCHRTNPVPVTQEDLHRLYLEAMA